MTRAAIATAAKQAWLAALEAHRQPWPEWAALEQRVRERTFAVHAIGPHVFVFAAGAGGAPPLSRQVTSGGAVPAVAPPFPGWVSALVKVGCDAAGELSSSGTLADRLWSSTALRPLSALEDWEHGCDLGPEHHAIARRTFALQDNRSGSPVFSDGEEVLAWDERARGFAPVAPLDGFLRFCLRCTLAGRDWWTDWTSGAGERAGLRAPP